MKTNLKIGVYLRVSTHDQSTELQRRELLSYAKARSWETILKYDDSGKSGTHGNRAQFRKLLQDCRERKIDIVLCWKLDRLFRSLKDLIATLQEFTELGVQFISLKDNIDLTTSSGRLMMHLIGAFAEFEAALIRERVRAGLENARAKGRQLGRPRVRNDESIRALRLAGHSYAGIQRQLGISKGAVCRALAMLPTHPENPSKSTSNSAMKSVGEK